MGRLKKERGRGADFHWGQSGHSGPSGSQSPALGAGPGPQWEPSWIPSPSSPGPGLTDPSAALAAPTQSIVTIAAITIMLISFFIACTATFLLVLKIKGIARNERFKK